MELIERRTPPPFCQYAAGPCDQRFTEMTSIGGIFLYPSDPPQIAATVETAVAKLRNELSEGQWLTWRNFQTTGQLIFCSICKNCRFAECVVTDVTTLNFNLMFEIGFALGLEIPVVPVRDTTFIRDKNDFDHLGILDVIGYIDFQNSDDLVCSLSSVLPGKSIPAPQVLTDFSTPLFVVKSALNTEAEIRLMSAIKKSSLNFRTYDPLEIPRLSLHEARRSVLSSLGVVAHLLSPHRAGATVHNARCAIIAGMATAVGKTVLLLQEGEISHPIDYRDIVLPYRIPDEIPRRIERFILDVIGRLQHESRKKVSISDRILQRLDLGDVAAENEIEQLSSYFVRTAQYNEAKRGHARLVVGRKGSGKSAIFYGIAATYEKSHSHLIVDLKPEGHQFTRLREAVLASLSPGMQEHTLTAFWNYILLCEIAQKVSDYEYSWAQRDPDRQIRFEKLVNKYQELGPADAGDMSERLLKQVDRISERFHDAQESITGSRITEILFKDDIKALDELVAAYLQDKDEVWLLVDNLDKGWPILGAASTEIMILRTLMEATRKLQRQLEQRGISFHSLVFLRNDIYEHLVRQTPDKGKDTAISLDWDDIEVFREIVRQRVMSATDLKGSFEDIWASICEGYIGAQETFRFIVERTLMRPRDLLGFLHNAVDTAVNRGHDRVTEDDLLKSEKTYSENMFLSLTFEINDVNPDVAQGLYNFLGCPTRMDAAELSSFLEGGKCGSSVDEAIRLLVWFGFLGVHDSNSEAPVFAYEMRYNLDKVLAPIRRGSGIFVIHPAFWRALDCARPNH